MPWEEVTRVSLREEFVQLAIQTGVNRRELCRIRDLAEDRLQMAAPLRVDWERWSAR